MGAKTTFQDLVNNYLQADKLNFGAFNILLSSSTGVPSANADVGSLYVDTNSGNLYRKTVSGAGAGNWRQISSLTSTVFQNHYRSILQNTVVTATDSGAASFGDLVGIYGAGTWTLQGSGGNLSASKDGMAAGGSQNAAWVAGGRNASTNSISNAELFNGSSWAVSGNLIVSKNRMMPGGSQNAAVAAGGSNAAAATISNTDLFNGSTWAASGNLIVSKYFAAAAGSQNALAIAGGVNTATNLITNSDLFNGSTWTTLGTLILARFAPGFAGAQNSFIVTGGGFTGGPAAGPGVSSTEIFNGSTWSTSGNLNVSRYIAASAGSQNAAFIAAGLNAAGSVVSSTELFNGSIWTVSGNLGVSRQGSAGCGSQNAGLIAGGLLAQAQNTTELHAQTTYRKLYSREYAGAKSVGILINANTVQQQGSVTTSVVYVPNKWLIVNRYLNSTPANDTSLTSVQLTSIQGSAPTATYNFSATVLSVMPGMMAVVTSSGATPPPAADLGTFLITRVISPGSIEINNPNSVAQNPATATISFISTMLAVDQIGPQDIVIGRTDDSGYLTIHKTIAISSLNKRLK